MKHINLSTISGALIIVILAALGTIAATGNFYQHEPTKPVPAVVLNTDANVGKCIQAHRVLWHETRGEAAEACLAELDAVGEQTFSQTWHNFETDLGQW